MVADPQAAVLGLPEEGVAGALAELADGVGEGLKEPVEVEAVRQTAHQPVEGVEIGRAPVAARRDRRGGTEPNLHPAHLSAESRCLKCRGEQAVTLIGIGGRGEPDVRRGETLHARALDQLVGRDAHDERVLRDRAQALQISEPIVGETR